MESTGRFTNELRRLMAQSYDICQSCRSPLPRDVAAYAGYAADGTPLYVGECCRHLINELATHVYWWWEVDKRCDPNTQLWRYMDFAKFIALLEQRSLYFSRADKLGDVFEGAMGIAERQQDWDDHYLDFFRHAVRTVPGQTEPPSEDHVQREAARLLKEMKTGSEAERKRYFVSCWHANTGESEALWRLYCPPPMMGVAIETNAQRLLESLGEDPEVKLGKVQYVDFRKTYAGIHDRIYWKRKSLSHEAEVRAVIRSFDPTDRAGIQKPIDLSKLLVSVVPSPFASTWFADLVERMMNSFGVGLPISRSEILSQPFF